MTSFKETDMSTTGIIDVEVIYRHHTDRAICVWTDETARDDIWLPLSAVEVDGLKARGRKVTVTGPETMFLEKGLI
jgi:hypothetical protein